MIVMIPPMMNTARMIATAINAGDSPFLPPVVGIVVGVTVGAGVVGVLLSGVTVVGVVLLPGVVVGVVVSFPSVPSPV